MHIPTTGKQSNSRKSAVYLKFVLSIMKPEKQINIVTEELDCSKDVQTIRLKHRQQESLSMSVSFLPFARNIIFGTIFPQATFLKLSNYIQSRLYKNTFLKLHQTL